MRARRRLAGAVKQLLLWLTIAGLLGPVAIVAIMSFSADDSLRFPPETFGTRQYKAATSSEWTAPLARSLQVAAAAAAAAVLVGVLFAIGRRRLRHRRLPGLELLILGPIVVPVVAYAVALFGVFADLHLLGSFAGVVIAHVALAQPFVVLIVGAALARVPPEYESAALSLGASPARAIFDGTLRAVAPAILAGCLLAFVTSFDEAVLVSFLSGPEFSTLPLEILRSLRTGVDPAITAVSTLLMGASGVLMGVFALVRRRQQATEAAHSAEATL